MIYLIYLAYHKNNQKDVKLIRYDTPSTLYHFQDTTNRDTINNSNNVTNQDINNDTNINSNKRRRRGGNIYGYYRPNYDLKVQYELYMYYVFVNKKPSRYEKELLNRRLPLTMINQWFTNARRRTKDGKLQVYTKFGQSYY
ncbi:hypothetical protein PIROE2DRAFT_10391 [Piromyces sp. E2]|nr:hypothetical protein PIROE2DRAFT_10391 [Piromyces sp. E2]|eukprot:OUM63130.1 hypothetical protein PIROE2DRAFT_10391 [Piromyces sp. E2]